MFGSLRGKIIEKYPPEVLIEVAGVGYEVQMPMTSIYQLGEQDEVLVYTHFVVREDAQLLFGFASRDERALFRELIKANGVGPKLALTIMSGMTAMQFVHCVHNEDTSSLVKLPGVGKKTAERLVVEMKDRLKNWQEKLAIAGELPMPPADDEVLSLQSGDAHEDAVSALVALGYKPAQASKAVTQVAETGMNSETLIREALKSMI